MGFVADVLDFVRVALDGGVHISETKADPGDGDNVTAAHFGAPGDDAHPLPGDQAVLVRVPGSGTVVAVGYLDTAREGEAQPGERRIYSRDSDGAIQATLWLKADGSVDIDAPNGMTINGVHIDADGNLTAPGEITAMEGPAQVSVSTHDHPSGTGPTGSPTPGS